MMLAVSKLVARRGLVRKVGAVLVPVALLAACASPPPPPPAPAPAPAYVAPTPPPARG